MRNTSLVRHSRLSFSFKLPLSAFFCLSPGLLLVKVSLSQIKRNLLTASMWPSQSNTRAKCWREEMSLHLASLVQFSLFAIGCNCFLVSWRDLQSICCFVGPRWEYFCERGRFESSNSLVATTMVQSLHVKWGSPLHDSHSPMRSKKPQEQSSLPSDRRNCLSSYKCWNAGSPKVSRFCLTTN
jgi:hypothetical protein